MSEEGVPATVLQFVNRHIESLEELEILLLLHTEPSKAWTVAEIFQKIQSTQMSVQHRLLQFEASGLIEAKGDGYRFKGNHEPIASVVAALAENYKDRRIRIIEAIYGAKCDPAQTFADAFKLRKKD